MAEESALQTKLANALRALGAKVIKQDPTIGRQRGIPDLLVLKDGWWGMLECKAHRNSPKRPGQQEWIDWCNSQSYGRFIYKENYDDILNELKEILK